MSYASVAAQNAPPPSEQPHPDPALLTTPADISRSTGIADDTAKVGTVSSDFKAHPATVTSQTRVVVDTYEPEEDEGERVASSAQRAKGQARAKAEKGIAKAKQGAHKAEEEGIYLWEVTKEYLFRPGVAGGLIGIVNVGLFSAASYHFYTRPHLRQDTRLVSSTVAGAVTLLGLEGYAAAQYRKTPEGREEVRRAKEEGDLIYRHAREVVLRPGVLGGLVGLVNVGILGAVGYLTYDNWDKPRWDRRIVSGVTIGLLTLWTGEGYLAEQIREGNVKPPRP